MSETRLTATTLAMAYRYATGMQPANS
jgi:hypothetical protein